MRPLTAFLFVCAMAPAIGTAQNQQPTGFHRVACIKVQPGKFAEFRQFSSGTTAKIMQAGIKTGAIAAWYQLRSVAPTGEAAQCDYVSVTFYPALPPPPTTRDQFAARLKQADSPMTVDEFLAKRDSLSRLVSQEIWRTIERVGETQQGDYMVVNWGKVPNMNEYIELERNVWKPMAEAWIKDGKRLRAWAVTVPVMPTGTERPYQAVSIDVYPNWESMFQPTGIRDMFARVHPGKDYAQTFADRVNKVRSLARRDLLVVEQLVAGPGAR